MIKVPINFDEMLSREILSLARKAVREFNERELQQFKVVEK